MKGISRQHCAAENCSAREVEHQNETQKEAFSYLHERPLSETSGGSALNSSLTRHWS